MRKRIRRIYGSIDMRISDKVYIPMLGTWSFTFSRKVGCSCNCSQAKSILQSRERCFSLISSINQGGSFPSNGLYLLYALLKLELLKCQFGTCVQHPTFKAIHYNVCISVLYPRLQKSIWAAHQRSNSCCTRKGKQYVCMGHIYGPPIELLPIGLEILQFLSTVKGSCNHEFKVSNTNITSIFIGALTVWSPMD